MFQDLLITKNLKSDYNLKHFKDNITQNMYAYKLESIQMLENFSKDADWQLFPATSGASLPVWAAPTTRYSATVLPTAHAKRFSVSCMRDFSLNLPRGQFSL